MMVFRHLPAIVSAAEFSPCRQFRYSLMLTDTERVSGKTVCVIMQNPSVANEYIADKSVQFLEKLIFRKGMPQFNGVNRCIIVNQFARVQTRNFKGAPSDPGADNDACIEKAVGESEIILIAWGKNNPFEERQNTILDLVRKFEGKTLLATRKHPSRGSYIDFIFPLSI